MFSKLFKTESNSTEQRPNQSSIEQKKIFNYGVKHVFNFINKLIKMEIFDFKDLIKTNYNDNIDRGNNYYFNQYLKKEIIVVIYNFCSDNDKNRLEYLYVIGKIKNFNYLKGLEMNFGVFLYKSGFPFSDEYKKKHCNLIIIEELKFPNSQFYLDKIGLKKISKRDKIIETFPNYEEIIKKFKLNESEIFANNNINNNYINKLIINFENQKNNSENSKFSNFDNYNTNDNNDNNYMIYDIIIVNSNYNQLNEKHAQEIIKKTK